MASINEFKSAFTGLAKPTLFKVSGMGADRDLEFFVKSASLPEITDGIIEVPYMGRKIKVPGDRTWQSWEIQVINDESYNLRKFFEDWKSRISNPTDVFGSQSAQDIKEDAFVESLAQDGSTIARYQLVGCWPSTLGAVEFSTDSNDTIEEFSVTIEFDWMVRL